MLTSSLFGGKWQNPTQTMLLLHVTETSKDYVSGTAGSRGSRNAVDLFFTHSPWMWVAFLGRLSPRGTRKLLVVAG